MYEYRAVVENVVDGDTVDLAIDVGFKLCTRQRVRLAGCRA
jgi:micrococcal nuclease